MTNGDLAAYAAYSRRVLRGVRFILKVNVAHGADAEPFEPRLVRRNRSLAKIKASDDIEAPTIFVQLARSKLE